MTTRNEVCILDDDIAVCNALRMLLELDGYQVNTYQSSYSFFAEPDHDCGCLIIDPHIPDLDLDKLHIWRRSKASAPSVVLVPSIYEAKVGRLIERLDGTRIDTPFTDGTLSDWIKTALGR